VITFGSIKIPDGVRWISSGQMNQRPDGRWQMLLAVRFVPLPDWTFIDPALGQYHEAVLLDDDGKELRLRIQPAYAALTIVGTNKEHVRVMGAHYSASGPQRALGVVSNQIMDLDVLAEPRRKA